MSHLHLDPRGKRGGETERRAGGWRQRLRQRKVPIDTPLDLRPTFDTSPISTGIRARMLSRRHQHLPCVCETVETKAPQLPCPRTGSRMPAHRPGVCASHAPVVRYPLFSNGRAASVLTNHSNTAARALAVVGACPLPCGSCRAPSLSPRPACGRVARAPAL